jgi:hypothetical protein
MDDNPYSAPQAPLGTPTPGHAMRPSFIRAVSIIGWLGGAFSVMRILLVDLGFLWSTIWLLIAVYCFWSGYRFWPKARGIDQATSFKATEEWRANP